MYGSGAYASGHKPRLLIISPCRDEAEFAPRTISSVMRQTHLPERWIIVDDGSSDGTAEILKQASAESSWMEVVTLPTRESRVLGSAVVHAFNAGLERVELDDFDYVSKLDMDLELPESYFEDVLAHMEADHRLGTASGSPMVLSVTKAGSRWVHERGSFEMSAGMAKVYRVSAFRQVGGLVPELMWDGIDCHELRRLGWKARSLSSPRCDFRHLRPEGVSDRGVLRGRRRHGYGQWFMGTDPLFMMLSALLRAWDEPRILGSLAMLWGYTSAALHRVPRYGSREFRRDLRRFQRESIFRGKRRATVGWEERAHHKWVGSRSS